MPIRVRCSGCKKIFSVKDHLAGKRVACPVCKNPLVIPAPRSKPVDVEALAAAALAGFEKEEEETNQQPTTIDMNCPFCDEDIQFDVDSNGKREPCPKCKNIVQVPRLEDDQQKNWRDTRRVGPSGAKINQMEQLEGAWGSTTDRGTVSGQALEEADAIPIEEEPIGVGGWIRRVVAGVVVVGLLLGAYWGIASYFSSVQQQGAQEEALDAYKKVEKELSPGWKAAFHLQLGEYYRRQNNPTKALEYFRKSRYQFTKKTGYDSELLLADVALAEIPLGGTEEQVIDETHLPWPEVQTEIGRVLSGIESREGLELALRKVCLRLFEREQEGIAIGLANQLSTAGAQSEAEKLAFLWTLKHKEMGQADKFSTKGKGERQQEIDILEKQVQANRLAHAQGLALQGNFPEAKEVLVKKRAQNSSAPANFLEQLRASLAVAEIALNKEAPDAARDNLDFALKLIKDSANKDQRKKLHPLFVCHLGRLLVELDMSQQAEEVIDFLERQKNLSPLAEQVRLALLVREAQKTNSALDADLIQNKKSLAYVQALLLESQQKTRLGNLEDVYRQVDSLEEKYQPFLLLGIATGR